MNEINAVPVGKMYSKKQVGLATFLGAPLAGAILMSRNAVALKQPTGTIIRYITIGIISTILLLVLAFILPENFPGALIAIPSLLAVLRWYSNTQEHLYRRHVSEGGRKGSWWYSIFIGVLSIIVIFGTLFCIIMILPVGIIE